MAKFSLITGATGGLGRAFVFECANRGDNLVLTGTNQTKLENITNEINEKFPNIQVISKTCDLSSFESRNEFFSYLKSQDIEIDFLVNNAGYIIEGEFLLHTNEEILKAIQVNCEGTIDMTQRVIKNRNKEEKLHIITIASMAGYYPMPYMAIYAGTKALLKNFMIALNKEMKGKNVFITTVCPSGIPTTDAMKEAIKSQGFAGEMTACSPEKIVKISMRASRKHKVVVVPKFINKFIVVLSNLFGDKLLASITGRMWKKSQDKRGFKGEK